MIRHPVRTSLLVCALVGLAAAVLAVFLTKGAAPNLAQAETARPAVAEGGSGLPLPRFVSLKSSKINVRRGPGQDYAVAFTFIKAGLPVEVIQEFDNWRKIRDWEGQEGWVFQSLLSGRRTAMVAPWQPQRRFAAYRSAGAETRIAAYLESRVVADVEECTGAWCLLNGESYSGWIEQEKLWGVYPGEKVGG